MNRAQKRAMDKRLRSVNGYTAYKKLVEDTMNKAAEPDMLKGGEKVKLNVDQITKRPEFERLNEKYKAFVLSNSDTEFTAKIRRSSKGGYPVIIDLEEDDAWSFWIGDLIRIKQ